jgi:hypothetical protein
MSKFPCPCCQSLVYLTPPNGGCSICQICNWEDDPIQSEDPNYKDGANQKSLNESQGDFLNLMNGQTTISLI